MTRSIEIFAPSLLASRPHVLSFEGRERVNGLYRFDVRLTLDGPDDVLVDGSLIETPIRLMLHSGDRVRSIHGIVLEAGPEAATHLGERLYRLTLGPRLALLKLRRYCRVFTESSVVEILTTLLTENRIAYRSRLQGKYARREYTVQYHESDYAFFRRLMRESGIFFTFDHPSTAGPDTMTNVGEAEVLVLADAPESYVPVEGETDFVVTGNTDALIGRDTQIFAMKARRAARSTFVLDRAYDFRRPDVDIRETASHRDPRVASAPHPVYAFGGDGDESPPELLPPAVRLDQERRSAYVVEGTSACARLMPGRTLSVESGEVASLSGSFVVSDVEHRAYAGDAAPAGSRIYENRFSCVLASTPLRPKRRHKERKQVVETAIVVGPAGKEIHTDAFGRIQVQFHWDLAGKRDGRTSTWLRVAQGWAGAGWGTQILPRVGMEVIVTFVGGDVDRPLVTGAVYNATHPLPFPQPAELTKSGLRSNSSPGGDGYNELSIDDAKGKELIFLRAEKDHTRIIQDTERVLIGKDQIVDIERDRMAEVKERDILTVGKERIEKVAGTQTGSAMSSGTISSTTGGATLTLSGNDATLNAAGNISLDAGGNVTVTAAGQITLKAPLIAINGGAVVAIESGSEITILAAGPISLKGAVVTQQ